MTLELFTYTVGPTTGFNSFNKGSFSSPSSIFDILDICGGNLVRSFCGRKVATLSQVHDHHNFDCPWLALSALTRTMVMMLIMMLMIRCDDSDTVDDDQQLDVITLFLVFTIKGEGKTYCM